MKYVATAPLGKALLIVGSLLSALSAAPKSAVAQEPARATPALDWCTLPLCRDAEGLRRQGDLQGALKLYRYIQEEIDVADTVLRKPLLWFPIAAIYAELQQPQQGLETLQKYQQYIATRSDADLPFGQRREDVERLQQSLTVTRLRLGGGSEPEPAPAAIRVEAKSDKGDPAVKLAPKVVAATERHIEAGLSLNKQGLYRSARVEFDQAYELSQRPELLHNLAQLLLGRGQPREAAIYLQRFVEVAPPGPARSEAEATLGRVRREIALEAEANRTAEVQRLVQAPGTTHLRRAGIALLTIGGGFLATGFGLGMGAVATANGIESAERFDPSQERLGRGLQNAGIAFDVLGAVSLGVGAVCLGVARRREAALPVNLRVAAAGSSIVLR
jgi:tetratricopeptide (TPR) repeat protein